MYNEHPVKERRASERENDEIDLWQLFKIFGEIGQKANNKISNALDLLRRRALLILGFIMAGIAMSYGAFKMTKPYYTSSMTFVLASIRNEFVKEQLNGLAEMVKEDNFEAISERLDISEESARQIKDLTFVNLDEEHIEDDSVLTGSPFRIELKLYDNRLYSSLEPAITNFLESNRYFSKQKQIKENQYRKLISKYRSEISSIDSIKGSVITPRGPVHGFVYGEPLDPTNLYRQGIDMYQQQVDLEADLDQLDNMQVVNGFVPRRRPSGPSLLMFLFIGAVTTFVVGFIVANVVDKKRR
ncbi:chain length determinant protein [Pontibacter qinzhouensis]|uniref:Chain length determinant protein n=1 Tax=Pontibacter qinzhouensis TaxID=2603253 RepID=A0A5C8IC46_9BACT|nr:chain length determinant protein [Pontibacter qinzhouensis]TXK18388.1 chain length determinant protein [Pontibacter qinzhouensis]